MLPVLCLSALPLLIAPAPAASEAASLLEEARTQAKRAVEAQKAAPGRVMDLSAAITLFAQRLAQEKRTDMRQVLLTSLYLFTVMENKQPASHFIATLKQEVPSTSPAWAVDVNLLPRFLETCFPDPHEAEAFAAPGREGQPDTNVRAALLLAQFQANQGLNDDVAQDALCRLESEFPQDGHTFSAQKNWDAGQHAPIGSLAPVLEVPRLGHPEKRFRVEDFHGEYVLVMFWASWCPLCRTELPNIHKAWERFYPKGLEVLSIALDGNEADVASFRTQPGFPMPWHHAWLPDALRERIIQDYGVAGIPKLLLVDPRGRIIAKDAALRGLNLEKTLALKLEKP